MGNDEDGKSAATEPTQADEGPRAYRSQSPFNFTAAPGAFGERLCPAISAVTISPTQAPLPQPESVSAAENGAAPGLSETAATDSAPPAQPAPEAPAPSSTAATGTAMPGIAPAAATSVADGGSDPTKVSAEERSDTDKTTLAQPGEIVPPLKLIGLDEAREKASPRVTVREVPAPTSRILIVEAPDIRLALAWADALPVPRKAYVSLLTSQASESDEILRDDNRRLLTVLAENIEGWRTHSDSEILLVINPQDRGAVHGLWLTTQNDAAQLDAFLSRHRMRILLLALDETAIRCSAALTAAERRVAPVEHLLEALFAAKGFVADDSHAAIFANARHDPVLFKRLSDALQEEDLGDAFLEEVAQLQTGAEQELHAMARTRLEEAIAASGYDIVAALFVASHFPDLPISDFSTLARDILEAPSIADVEDRRVFDDRTMIDAGLRRTRVRLPTGRLKTVARFEKRGGYPAAVRLRLQSNAALFLEMAFEQLAAELSAGSVGTGTAAMLSTAVAEHIARAGDGDINNDAAAFVRWLGASARAESDLASPERRKRANAVSERASALLTAGATGLVRESGASLATALQEIGTALLKQPVSNAFTVGAQTWLRAQGGLAALGSGSSSESLRDTIEALSEADRLVEWLTISMAGSNFGLAQGISAVEAIDEIIKVCTAISNKPGGNRLQGVAERLLRRGLVARMALDEARLLADAEPEPSDAVLRSLVAFSGRKKPFAESTMTNEMYGAAILGETSHDSLEALCAFHRPLRTLLDAPSEIRRALAAGEACFRHTSAILAAIVGTALGEFEAGELAYTNWLGGVILEDFDPTEMDIGTYSEAFYWVRDEWTDEWLAPMQRLVAIRSRLDDAAPVITAAMACAKKGDDGTLSCTISGEYLRNAVEREDRERFVSRAERAIETAEHVQDIWLRGVDGIEPRRRGPLVAGVMRRRRLLRSFLTAVLSACR